jgi:RNA polymerase sigma-70 factor (ECF subfamily)
MSLPAPDTPPDSDAPIRAWNLSALYREHAATVARWAAKLAGPGADVDDLVHEIFLVVGRRLPEFRGQAKVTTWLYRITDLVVREHRRKERFRRWFSRARHLEIESTLTAPHLTPVEALERHQAASMTYRILDRMPDKYRNVLILFEMEELSGEEIAALTGLKLSTVWVHLHRARARFLADMKRVLERQS